MRELTDSPVPVRVWADEVEAMAQQSDLVATVHTLKQLLCVEG